MPLQSLYERIVTEYYGVGVEYELGDYGLLWIALFRTKMPLRHLNERIATSSYEVGVAHEYEIMTYYR
ncbi:hypothetical protein ESP60_00475 [Anaplasma phagocytophilum]|nr:hypothetical protein ESP60_00475 [Anaplasma phagocytophilum]